MNKQLTFFDVMDESLQQRQPMGQVIANQDMIDSLSGVQTLLERKLERRRLIKKSLSISRYSSGLQKKRLQREAQRCDAELKKAQGVVRQLEALLSAATALEKNIPAPTGKGKLF